MATLSHWKKVRMPRFAPLRESLRVDVLVVGGGMTGISVAYLLKKAGKKVLIFGQVPEVGVNVPRCLARKAMPLAWVKSSGVALRE